MEIFFTSHRVISQVLGTDNEHMVSEITYVLNGKSGILEINQPAGESHSYNEDPLVFSSIPDELKILNTEQLREVCENYIKSNVGNSSQNGIRIVNSTSIKMDNVSTNRTVKYNVDKISKIGGGW